MKYLCFTLLIIATLLNADHCDKVKEKADDTVALGSTFELMLNKSVMIEGENIGIQLLNVAESRCPMNTNCIRAGEAIATLKVIGESDTQELKLEVKAYCNEEAGTCGETGSAMGYSVKLINVYPYPGSEDAGEKRVKMVVDKG